MARVTIEDCLTGGVDNRFELVMLATKRARHLANGADSEIARDGDKVTVWALREIAEGKISMDFMHKNVDNHTEHNTSFRTGNLPAHHHDE